MLSRNAGTQDHPPRLRGAPDIIPAGPRQIGSPPAPREHCTDRARSQHKFRINPRAWGAHGFIGDFPKNLKDTPAPAGSTVVNGYSCLHRWGSTPRLGEHPSLAI